MNKDLIYDIGFHKGEDTVHYLSKGFRVVAIDANPVLIAEGEKKFHQEIKSGQLVLINLGVGETEAKSLDFYINDSENVWSSFWPEAGMRGNKYHCVKVPVTTISALFRSFGVPYYLKVDIEGNDIYCARGLVMTQLPEYVSFELSDITLVDILYQKGYNKFKIINQRNRWRPLEIKKEFSLLLLLLNKLIFRVRCYIYIAFPSGSTGPFGEDTYGEWLDYKDVKSLMLGYQNLPKPIFFSYSWFDLHAKKML